MTSQNNNKPDLKDQRRAEIRGVIAMSIPVVITTSSRALMDIADYVMITWLGVDEVQRGQPAVLRGSSRGLLPIIMANYGWLWTSLLVWRLRLWTDLLIGHFAPRPLA